ncbi:hypothetical protein NKJ74_05590 [Mesorhizobium sp. M0046]|uniref:hypothetical protein n=1 Tax=Mesorhizobium sp. M0046 TaxID=2956858 RepID=UPI00333B39B9
MTQINDLLIRIQAYCQKEGIAESTFGFRAVNDGKLVKKLRAGHTITLRTFHRIEAFLAAEEREAA